MDSRPGPVGFGGLTWGRGTPRARPAAGYGPCSGWTGPNTAAVCGRCSERSLRPRAGSPVYQGTARSQTSDPPEETQTSFNIIPFRNIYRIHNSGSGEYDAEESEEYNEKTSWRWAVETILN